MNLVWMSGDDDRLRLVIELADKNKATLGLMPRGAFADFADRRLLLTVVNGTDVGGYALFDVARNRVRLIHLCVADEYRGQGVSRMLVEELSNAHSDLTGITLKCRRDYPANQAWPKLGFSPVNEVRGRGKSGTSLDVWRRGHGHPHLFSVDIESDLLTVAIDYNVFLDLAIDSSRSGAAESQALESDWLRDQLQLVVTEESLHELNRLTRERDRAVHRAKLDNFRMLEPAPANRQRAHAALAAAAPELLASHLSDFNHLVMASAGGASVFVTRDEELISSAENAAGSSLGLSVMRPSDVLVHIDELAHAERYRPAALHGTAFNIQDAPPGLERELAHLLDTGAGERRTHFSALLRSIAADPKTAVRLVRGPTAEVEVAWAARRDDVSDSIVIPLLRAAKSKYAPTLIRLVLFELRSHALTQNINSITVLEGGLDANAIGALTDNAFTRGPGGWTAAVLDVTSLQAASGALPHGHPLRDQISQVSRNPAELSVSTASTLEHALWPAKLLDTMLPSYITPIQPRFARELFNLQDPLWDRPALLGISSEHVYYRSPLRNPSFPARILWYASGRGRDRIGAVVACSQLVQVVTGTPAELHRRFRHLGVYREDDIRGRASAGRASALRFIDTERLVHPVSFDRLQVLNGPERRLGTLQSPTRISAELFGAIYREGTRRFAS